MKNKKYIILMAVIALYIIGILTFYLIKQNNTNFIVLPDGNNIKYDGKWSIVSNDELIDKKYLLVKDGNYYLNSKIEIKDDIVFLSNQELIDSSMAYRGNKLDYIEYSVVDFEEEDFSFVNNILSSNSITVDLINLTYSNKYKIDLNYDGTEEIVYSISNNYNIDNGDLFSLVLVRSNNNYVIIELDKFDEEYSSYLPYLYFINVNKDEIGEIIIKNTYSSLIGQDTKIITFDNEIIDYETIFEEAKK